MVNPTACFAALVVVLSMVACTDEQVDSCIDDAVTIEQGVYGQFLNGCDTVDCMTSYALGMEVRVYDSNPTPGGGSPHQGLYDVGTNLSPVVQTSSVHKGFYELDLPPATYYLCTNNCSEVVIPPLQPLIRRDWASGPGGGNWWEGMCR